MIVSVQVPSVTGARGPGFQIKPPTPRLTSAAAVPADVPAFICTQQSGVVTCTDEAGSPVQGEQLRQLQALLKPIADAPALVDEPVKAQVSSGCDQRCCSLQALHVPRSALSCGVSYPWYCPCAAGLGASHLYVQVQQHPCA